MPSLFSLLGTRKKVTDLSPYMRRICDLSTPNFGRTSEPGRATGRYNRTLPVLLCPWNDGRPQSEQVEFAVTKDIADYGVSVVTNNLLEGELVVGFSLPESGASEPWFFLGNVVQSTCLGGSFWVIGIELFEFASANYRRDLQKLYPLAEQLRPCPDQALSGAVPS